MTDVDVAIVGGGPVGLGLAIDLSLRGVRVRVLERANKLHNIPKGQNLTQRTGEHFRAWGVTEMIAEATPIPRAFGNAGLVAYGSLLSGYSYDWFQRSKVAPYYFAQNERLPQYRTEAVLRARAAQMSGLHFDVECKVTNIRQDMDAVCVDFTRDGVPETITARYVVGCDGARSIVRERAGIVQETDHQGPKMALLVFRSKELDTLLERYPGKSIFNVMNPDLDGYWQFLGRVDLDGTWFYHSPVPEDATAETYDFAKHLHEMVGTEFALNFEHIGFWDLRISHAVSYRNQRVFIAGDAAHSHPPYGGYGVNTGLEDARNLSWKLAADLHGWAGKALLDSYSSERHPVFQSTSRDFIERMILDFRTFLSAFSPEQDRPAFEAAWAARAHGGNSDVTEFLPNYAGSPIILGELGQASGAKGKHGFRAIAGHHLAPQDLPDGRDLWDALGSGFTLITFAENSSLEEAFDQAAETLNVPLIHLHAPSDELEKVYDAQAILVRPDQFVAWAGNGGASDQKDSVANGLDPLVILARAIGDS